MFRTNITYFGGGLQALAEIFLRCGPAGVFEEIPELEFDQTANLAAEAGHNLWTHLACADAKPIPELEFDQTLRL